MDKRKYLKNVHDLSVNECIESAKINGYTRHKMASFIYNPNATEGSKWVVYSEGNINTNRGNNQVVDVFQLVSITPGKRGSPKRGNTEVRCAVAHFKNLKTGASVSCNQRDNPKLKLQLVEYGIGKDKVLKPVSIKTPVDNNFSDLSKLSKQDLVDIIEREGAKNKDLVAQNMCLYYKVEKLTGKVETLNELLDRWMTNK